MEHVLPICKQIFSSKNEMPKTFEVTLPEYCPGITRVVKCDCICTVADSSYENGVVSSQIKAEARVVYISEQRGYLKAAVFPLEFVSVCDASRAVSGDSAKEIVKVCNYSCTAKPKGARSLEIKLVATVGVSLYLFEEHELFYADGNSDAELRTKTQTAVRRNIFSCRADEISEAISIDASMPPVAEIVDYSINPITDTVRTKDGELVFSGKANFSCIYRAEGGGSDTAEYIYLTKEIPFSGELASEKIKNGDRALLSARNASASVSTAFDPYGESRVINVSTDIVCNAEIFGDCEIEYADDGYCSAYECSFEMTEYACDTVCCDFNEQTEISEKFAADKAPLSQITETAVCLSSPVTEASDGRLYIDTVVTVTVFGSLESGEPSCIRTSFDAKFPIEGVAAQPEKRYIANTQVLSATAEIAYGEIIVTAVIETTGIVLEKRSIRAISKAEIAYDEPKPMCRSEYIIYYPDSGETLWDVAKKYEIPQKTLAEANGISDGVELEKKTVLIPCNL